MKVRTRFAPSPTGFMHIGNLRTALYNYLFAKSTKGTFVLRIEDTDKKRQVSGAEEFIYKALELTNLKPDESPRLGGNYGPYIQSERLDLYKKYANQLIEKGCAYYCFCDKCDHEEKLEEDAKLTDVVRCDCRNLSTKEALQKIESGKSYVIRQRIPLDGQTTYHDEVYGDVTVENSILEDQILIKSDGYPTYNFANVIDDHLMEITHILRGKEYISSTPKYSLLYSAFGWDAPKTAHLSTICAKNEDGSISKLSKRHGAVNLEDLIKEGYLVDALINYIALLGWSPKQEREIFSLSELSEIFNLDGLVRSDSIFDYKKLDWFNGEYIKNLSNEDFIKYSFPFVSLLPSVIKDNWVYLSQFLQTRISKATEIAEKVSFFYDYNDNFDIELLINKKNKTTLESCKDVLKDIIPEFENINCWDVENLNNVCNNYAEKIGAKLGFVMWPVRLSVSGQTVTPCGSAEILYVLGKDESLKRMKSTLERL
jgi:glutamyl-tRNA synthetase